MMDSSTLVLGIGVGGLLLAMLLVALIIVLLQLGKVKRDQAALLQEHRSLEDHFKKLKNKIEFLNAGSLGLGQRLMSTEKRLSQSLEKQDELVHSNTDHLYRRQADRLLKGSALNTQDDSAVTRSEAKLMALVGKKNIEKN